LVYITRSITAPGSRRIFVPLLDDLERKWILKCQTGAIRRRLEITSEGLLLGAGTCLAKMIRDAGGAPVLALDGQGSRIIALLSVACERAVPASVMDTLRKASDFWSRGEKALAHVHLSFFRAPPFETNEQAFRLFAANEPFEAGLSPRRLMKALDLDPAPLDILQKYNPDQPRVPAGSGRISGEWGDGTGANTPAPRVTLIGHGQTLSDISAEPAGPSWQVAQSLKVTDLPDGTLVSPYGEKAVSYKNLPMNARQILGYRGFVQDDVTGEWYVGMDLPPDSEARFTLQVRGQDAGLADSGYVIAPPGSPALPPEGSEDEPKSGLRYGDWNPYTLAPYFKVFNDEGQAISPVTGRTVGRLSSEAHYPVDPVKAWFGHWFGGWFGGP
jgi:hypothetical protein